jgi:hypothetical protein
VEEIKAGTHLRKGEWAKPTFVSFYAAVWGRKPRAHDPRTKDNSDRLQKRWTAGFADHTYGPKESGAHGQEPKDLGPPESSNSWMHAYRLLSYVTDLVQRQRIWEELCLHLGLNRQQHGRLFELPWYEPARAPRRKISCR